MNNEKISSKIWQELPEPDNPFAASVCYCSGYDVYGEILRKASWVEYLYLLFQGERPSNDQVRLLELLAIALANPGPRDHSVRAAMNGGVSGSTNASSLMAALAVGSGALGGSRELVVLMRYWSDCGRNLDLWTSHLLHPPQEERLAGWVSMEHPPGFDPHGAGCAKPVLQTLDCLSTLQISETLNWLRRHRADLELVVDLPLAMIAVVAAACVDLALGQEKAEMLYLLLRLPGAAVHALEQRECGWRKYPFFNDAVELLDDPASN